MTTPKLRWDPLEVHAGFTEDLRFTLYDDESVAAAIAASDVVRFKLKRTPGTTTVTLEISSLAATANGSVVEKVNNGVAGSVPAVVNVRFGQLDTRDLTPGEWYGVLGLVDDSETNPENAFKIMAHGTIQLKPPPGGSVAIS